MSKEKEIRKLVEDMFQGKVGAIQFNDSKLFVKAVKKVIDKTRIESFNQALKDAMKQIREEMASNILHIQNIIEGLKKK